MFENIATDRQVLPSGNFYQAAAILI
jgi:hypothetical protein